VEVDDEPITSIYIRLDHYVFMPCRPCHSTSR